jgi:hypothetical protein
MSRAYFDEQGVKKIGNGGRNSMNYSQPKIKNPYSNHNHLNELGFFDSNDFRFNTPYNGARDDSVQVSEEINQGEFLEVGSIKERKYLRKDHVLMRRNRSQTFPYALVKSHLDRNLKMDLRNLNGGELDWNSLSARDGDEYSQILKFGDDKTLWDLAKYLFHTYKLNSDLDSSGSDFERDIWEGVLTKEMMDKIDPLFEYVFVISDPDKKLIKVIGEEIDLIDVSNMLDLAEDIEISLNEKAYGRIVDDPEAIEDLIYAGIKLDLLKDGDGQFALQLQEILGYDGGIGQCSSETDNGDGVEQVSNEINQLYGDDKTLDSVAGMVEERYNQFEANEKIMAALDDQTLMEGHLNRKLGRTSRRTINRTLPLAY